MGLELEKGSHDITIRYSPAGFKAGVAISAVSVILIALVAVMPLLLKKTKKPSVQAESVKKSEAAGEIQAETVSETVIEEVPVSDILPAEPAEDGEPEVNDDKD